MNKWLIVIMLFILARTIFEIILNELNYRHLLRNSYNLPDFLKQHFSAEVVKTCIEYQREKTKVNITELIFSAILILVILFSGILGLILNSDFALSFSTTVSRAIFTFVCLYVFSLFALPFALYREFVVEKKFGFSTISISLWLMDYFKGLALSGIISISLLFFFLYLFENFPKHWVYIFWLGFVLFQLLLVYLAPRIIMPLFNKFEKLPDCELKYALINLSYNSKFPIASIEIMDESKRSRHSNAFFTGFGSNRKVVLFDTLIELLSIEEIVSVVAHEIGHYKLGHLVKGLIFSGLSIFIGLLAIDFIFRAPQFFEIFSITNARAEFGIIILALLGRELQFWFLPIGNMIFRNWEYSADKYAVEMTGVPEALISGLIKLHAENRSNIYPHPLFSKIYYSHPSIIERIEKIKRVA